jgi:hypothetical protein
LVLDGSNLAGFQLLIPFNFILLSLPFIVLRGLSYLLVSLIFLEERLVLVILLEHYGLVFSAVFAAFAFVFVDDICVSTHAPIILIGYEFTVKLVVK